LICFINKKIGGKKLAKGIIKRPRGTNDILPEKVWIWQYVENIIRDIAVSYAYKEIRTPVFEHTELFERGVGGSTDIVGKEMYTFEDRGDRSITLRPEGTAPVVRAYLENGLLALPQPVKLFYIGPMFRYERSQSGRYRQFHQFGVEVLGVRSAEIDAEVIAMCMEILKKLGLKDVELHLNNLGCAKCRVEFKEKLKLYLEPILHEYCKDCKQRFDRNVLRIIDCKNDRCKELSKDAPAIMDCVCDECKSFYKQVEKNLNALGIDYITDKNLVRGLDYYTNTAFEVMIKGNFKSSVGGGGRYDGLAEILGGNATPAVGFALGLERVVLALKSQNVKIPVSGGVDVFIAIADESANLEAVRLLSYLRGKGYSADKDYANRSLKAQMKYANKLKARYVLIIGENELKNNKLMLKNMQTGQQLEIDKDKLLEIIGGELNGK